MHPRRISSASRPASPQTVQLHCRLVCRGPELGPVLERLASTGRVHHPAADVVLCPQHGGAAHRRTAHPPPLRARLRWLGGRHGVLGLSRRARPVLRHHLAALPRDSDRVRADAPLAAALRLSDRRVRDDTAPRARTLLAHSAHRGQLHGRRSVHHRADLARRRRRWPHLACVPVDTRARDRRHAGRAVLAAPHGDCLPRQPPPRARMAHPAAWAGRAHGRRVGGGAHRPLRRHGGGTAAREELVSRAAPRTAGGGGPWRGMHARKARALSFT